MSVSFAKSLEKWLSESLERIDYYDIFRPRTCHSSRHALKRERFFQCSACSYLADLDYIAAINIYRVYQELRKKRFSLTQAKPVPYMATGIPLNRPSGDSTHLLMMSG
jgi:hypothetical protein